MRIVDRQTFLALPAGTVYQKWEPCFFGETCIKGETTPHDDWYETRITGAIEHDDSEEFFERCTDMAEQGASVPMEFDTICRDGFFDQDQLFAVFEPADVAALIGRLTRALNDSLRASPPAP